MVDSVFPSSHRESDGLIEEQSTALVPEFALREEPIEPSTIITSVMYPPTVKSHINSIYAKLHLRDRVHAVILGYEIWPDLPRPIA